MAMKYKTVVTTAGVAKFAAALTPGGKKVNITAMAVGDGGGTLPEPNAGQTKLINEVWRHTLNKISQDNKYKNYVVAELVIPPETGGFWLREMGLYDDTGTLVAVGNMAESYKPKLEEGSGRAQTLRMVIMLSDVASVALSVDGSIVMATQDYVDDKLAEHEKSRRHPDATLTEKGFTQLSNATNSEAENLAATPKAVKAAFDLASGKYTAQDATTAQKGLVQLSSATDSNAENAAATPKAVKAAMDDAATRLAKEKNGADIPDTKLFVKNIGLENVLFKGDGRWLTGTFINKDEDAKSIGERAAIGCQFMRAYKAPDAPDQSSYWQIISLNEVVNKNTVVNVMAFSGNNILFGYGTGAGITSWHRAAMLEGAEFTGDITAKNIRGDTAVTVGDGTGGLKKGDTDGAGFNGNNLNIMSWNGIGFQNASDKAIRAYISTALGVIAAAERVYAGNASLNKNGDVYGDAWDLGAGAGWLSSFIGQKPGRQYITQIGVYQNDKSKPFMLHDDNSGIFLATTDMLSGYVQSIRFGAVEQGMVWRAPGFADQVGYVITGIENADSNDTPDRIQRRLLQLRVNGQWYTVGA